MPTFLILGADKQSARDRMISVTAWSRKDAEEEASQRGLLVGDVVELQTNIGSAGHPWLLGVLIACIVAAPAYVAVFSKQGAPTSSVQQTTGAQPHTSMTFPSVTPLSNGGAVFTGVPLSGVKDGRAEQRHGAYFLMLPDGEVRCLNWSPADPSIGNKGGYEHAQIIAVPR